MMKTFLQLSLSAIAFSLFFMACKPASQGDENTTISQPDTRVENNFENFTIFRGTNIAHWLSQSSRRGEERQAFFTRRDVAQIDTLGFDHIRLPIDEEQMWDEEGNRNDDAFELLGDYLDWCKEFGLRTIIDLHILRSHHFNADEKPLWTDPAEQDKFIGLWKDLSGFLKPWPNGMVAYEFMNEPVADDPEEWNQLIARVVDSIRQWEPDRILVIGSNRWQSANTFDQLKVPAGDKNIILSFHFYEPFHLTHVRASWTHLKDFEGEVNYPGQIVPGGTEQAHQRVYNRDTLAHMMRKPLHLADSLGLPLFCGEFGVIEKAPREPLLAWYKDMVSIFEEHNVAYANWNYKAGSFETVDENNIPDDDLVKILTGKK
ncbi:MAG: glycoside hydrolase family 5 protein [Cyclobacteriaceae bacterium]|nr:glycoside hydrolase family 5 protein [Cyclobacteriaceae bacterium]